MIQWLKAQLPSARRAQQAAYRQAERDRTATEADHDAWLASLPDALRAHPRLQTRSAQDDARQWADLTPPSDRAHALQRHLRWTTAPPDLPDGTMATKIALLMVEATNAEGRFYLPKDVAMSFDGALDWCGLTAFLGGTTPALPLDTLFMLQRFYQTSPLYFLPSFLPRSHWRTTMFGKGRLWAEGMIRRLEGDVYTEPLFGLATGRFVGEEDGDV